MKRIYDSGLIHYWFSGPKQTLCGVAIYDPFSEDDILNSEPTTPFQDCWVCEGHMGELHFFLCNKVREINNG